MQRASSTTNRYEAGQGNTTVNMAQELPWNYGGIYTGKTNEVNLLTHSFSEIAQAYTNRQAMTAYNTNCDNCTTFLQV